MTLPPATLRLPPVPAPARELLHEFAAVHAIEIRLWAADGSGGWIVVLGPERFPGEPGATAVPVPVVGSDVLRWQVEPVGEVEASGVRLLAFALGRLLRYDQEVQSVTLELSERYEEITFLYSTSEILGSTLSLEAAAGTILGEVVDLLGAGRATLWVYEPERQWLALLAAVGGEGRREPIPVDDPEVMTARVFRNRTPLVLDLRSESEGPREPMVSVPVSYTPPRGEARTVGVINVAGRRSGERFSAGDVKLLSAIASQIGAAVENRRLVTESLRQERLVRELELAHDLQMKLLPPAEAFSDLAQVAARSVPAESVGGDFYHLFRLSGGRLGTTVGDVSSHGFGAALIMALAMSALAVHANEGHSPGEVLRRVQRELIDELDRTEMYLTLLYAVLDPAAGRLVYANAGHPYAFRVRDDGSYLRLGAIDLPLGMLRQGSFTEAEVDWVSGSDTLFLFTDGLAEPLDTPELAGDQRLLAEVTREVGSAPAEILDRIFRLGGGDVAVAPPDDRTALLVRI